MVRLAVPDARMIVKALARGNVGIRKGVGTRPRRRVASNAIETSEWYDWETLTLPRLDDGGQLFSEETRVRAAEVGPNQQSNVITVSNMLQVG